MKISSAIGSSVPVWRSLLAIFFLALAGAVAADSTEGHLWKHIMYPPVSVAGMPGSLAVLVNPASHDDLGFSVRYVDMSGRDFGEDKVPEIISAPGKITVRMHFSDGRVVSPRHEGLNTLTGIGNGRGTAWSLMYKFPWGGNKLDEAWIELRLPQQTLWVELPYGFTRKPTDPLLADEEHGIPVFPPAMKDLNPKDVLVPWLFVYYDLGPIQNHWRLLLQVSNPFTARAEAILYREDGKWDLHAPRTTMAVEWPGGHSEAHCVGIRRTDVFRRSDDYLLGFGPGPEKGRLWGKVVIKVDDERYECVVPSSVFKYTHGITDPYHKQRLARPKPPDGDF